MCWLESSHCWLSLNIQVGEHADLMFTECPSICQFHSLSLTKDSLWQVQPGKNWNSLYFEMKWSSQQALTEQSEFELTLFVKYFIIFCSSHNYHFFFWAVQHITHTTAGERWDCSSSCVQQLCFIHDYHHATFWWNDIFPGHHFLTLILYLTSYFWISECNRNFITKIFSHSSLPFINLKHGHWQLFWWLNRLWKVQFFISTLYLDSNLHTATCQCTWSWWNLLQQCEKCGRHKTWGTIWQQPRWCNGCCCSWRV